MQGMRLPNQAHRQIVLGAKPQIGASHRKHKTSNITPTRHLALVHRFSSHDGVELGPQSDDTLVVSALQDIEQPEWHITAR